MKHTIITIDIASSFTLDEEAMERLDKAIDIMLANDPIEYEDWKVHYHTEERPV